MQMVEEEVNNIDMMGLSTREMEIISMLFTSLQPFAFKQFLFYIN